MPNLPDPMPAEYFAGINPTLMADALREAEDDLTRILDAVASSDQRRDFTIAGFVQAILLKPQWGRLELASVLGAAVDRILAAQEAGEGGSR